jgi:fructose-1,6-bisphosphatase II
MPMNTVPDRNIAMELVRVTEAAALASARWMGRGNKEASDQAAVDAMRLVLNTIQMDGVIVIGEGEKDEAPMLYNGERLGTGEPPLVDIAVDPIDGTRLLSLGRPGSLSVVALSERGTMYAPGKIVYMDKIAVGPEAKGVIDINAPVADNLRAIARAKGKDMDDLTVVVLDRPRHEKLIADIRGHRGHRHGRAHGRGRFARGGHHSVCPQVHRRRHAVQTLAAQRRGAPLGSGKRPRTGQGSDH